MEQVAVNDVQSSCIAGGEYSDSSGESEYEKELIILFTQARDLKSRKLQVSEVKQHYQDNDVNVIIKVFPLPTNQTNFVTTLNGARKQYV